VHLRDVHKSAAQKDRGDDDDDFITTAILVVAGPDPHGGEH